MSAVPRMPDNIWQIIKTSAETGQPSLATSVLTGGRGIEGFEFDYNFDPPWQENYILDERKSKIVWGGYGSGKTLATVMGMLWFAFVLNDFRGGFAAPRNKQTTAALEMIDNRRVGTVMEQYIRIVRSPTPRVDVQFIRPDGVFHHSSIVFLNSSDGFVGGLSLEFDWAHAEEALTLSPATLESVVRNLGSRARGRAVDGRERLGWFTMTSNPEKNPYGWFLFDIAREHPDDWFVYVVPSFANKNVPDEHLLNTMKRMTNEDEVLSYLLGKRPPDDGAFFPPRMVSNTRDDELETRVVNKRKHGKFTVYFEIPPKDGAVYVIGVDLGTGTAPFRNSPVIIVYEIDGRNVNIVYMWWGSGRNFQYVIDKLMDVINKYRPLRVHIDATGSQRGMFTLIQNEAIKREYTTPLIGYQVSKEKKSAMVYAINALLMNNHLRIPATSGEDIIGQLIAYPGPEEDKKTDQDIVMAMSMAAPDVWSIVSAPAAQQSDIDELLSVNPHRLDETHFWQ